MRFRVAVVGVTGYSGLELMKIILRHPGMECVSVMASEATGEKRLDEIHPCLRGLSNHVCHPQNAERLASGRIDTVFLCTPNEVSHQLVPKLISRGMRVIDLSGSFRLRDPRSYSSWYGFEHKAPELLEIAAYGLPEWNAAAVRGARLVANPGCYPTSVLLPLLPLVEAGILEPGSAIICDSKSGVTGAGRAARLEMLFGEVSGNFRPYSPVVHRHVPEMTQALRWKLEDFTFVPHLLPVTRGILSTLYVCFRRRLDPTELEAEYRRIYSGRRFIRIMGSGSLPELRSVNHTNFCDIGWRLTEDIRRGVIFCAIDNLIKGAAGQAIQNFNLMHDMEETLGLLEGESVAIHD